MPVIEDGENTQQTRASLPATVIPGTLVITRTAKAPAVRVPAGLQQVNRIIVSSLREDIISTFKDTHIKECLQQKGVLVNIEKEVCEEELHGFDGKTRVVSVHKRDSRGTEICEVEFKVAITMKGVLGDFFKGDQFTVDI